MSYAIFPGCLISSRFPHIESSAMKVLKAFGVKLMYLEDTTCCPEPVSMQILNPKAWYAIAARNICLAEQKGVDLLTLCNGCNATLFKVNENLKSNNKLRTDINEILKAINKKFEGKISVKSMLRVLYQDVGPDKIKSHVKRPLYGIRVAVHYGCHIFEELKEYDDPKKPRSLEDLVKALGADVVTYPSEMLCCGAFARPIDEELSLKFTEEKLDDLTTANADCLVVMCPYCFFQFDFGQTIMARKFKKKYQVPIFFLSQLLGLAIGFNDHEMGLEFHKVKSNAFIEKFNRG